MRDGVRGISPDRGIKAFEISLDRRWLTSRGNPPERLDLEGEPPPFPVRTEDQKYRRLRVDGEVGPDREKLERSAKEQAGPRVSPLPRNIASKGSAH